MTLAEFQDFLVRFDTDEDLLDFCRKHILHGIPFVFSGRDDDFYEFRKRIATKFEISFHEIYVIGSAKLGFSSFKNTLFDYDSDIDIAIVSDKLFENIMANIAKYQMRIRKSRAKVSDDEIEMYHVFLEYIAIGWMRPDKLPVSFQMKSMKDDWFGFFRDISNGKSEVGNYRVNAGVFKSYKHLETYIVSGLEIAKRREIARQYNDSSD